MEVTRDLLLSRLIMVYRGQEITVKNLVRYVAHVAGGVHLYAPKNEQEPAVQSLANEMRIGGQAAGTRTLLAVGRVV
jgi:hypothetical protein